MSVRAHEKYKKGGYFMSVNNVNGGIRGVQGQANGKAQGAEKQIQNQKRQVFLKRLQKLL